MRVFTALLVAAAALGAPATFAVEPAYRGPLGNNEEPAMRPYKWIYSGLKSLVFHTGDQFVEGNMHFPVLGTVQGLRGLRRGTVKLGESTFEGAVYAPPPARDYYKDIGDANRFIEDDWFLRNSSDFLFMWYFFPAQKVVDHYPLEGDVKVEIRRNEAKVTRENRKLASELRREPERPRMSRVERAQRKYIGERADYGTEQSSVGRGNLKKLAR